jgi:hypothetical protein
VPTKYSFLCSKHFGEEDFEPPAEFRKVKSLKRGAVPSVFDFPKHLQPKIIKLRKPPTERNPPAEQNPPHQEVAPENEEMSQETKENTQSLINIIHQEHNYSLPDAIVLKKRLESSEKRIDSFYTQLTAERKKSSYQKKKINSLENSLKELKENGLIDSQGKEHLQGLLTPALEQILERIQCQKNRPTTIQYPPEIRVFASTLQFYSTKAYEYVRKTFSNALPHITTVRKWFSNIEGAPGFSAQAFNVLKEKVEEGKADHKSVFVALMLDDMSVKKQIEYDSKTSSFKGFVNIGAGESNDDSKPATEVLIIMAVGINWHFKIPLAYFFIAGIVYKKS